MKWLNAIRALFVGATFILLVSVVVGAAFSCGGHHNRRHGGWNLLILFITLAGKLADPGCHLMNVLFSENSHPGLDCIKGFRFMFEPNIWVCRFEPENDTKSIVSIIGPQNVGPLDPHFDPDM